MKFKKYYTYTFIFFFISFLIFINCFDLTCDNKSLNDNKEEQNEKIIANPHVSNAPLVEDWHKDLDYDILDRGTGIAVDSSDNIFVCIDSGDTSYLVKYNSTGAKKWERSYSVEAQSLCLDSKENIYLAGWSSDINIEFQIVKYNKTGDFKWSRKFGGYKIDELIDIAIDSLDNLYVSGCTKSFGNGDRDLFVAKFDSFGNQNWNITWGGTKQDIAYGLALDNECNIYITGNTYSYGALQGDLLLMKINNSGIIKWNYTWVTDEFESGYGIVLDSLENIYIGGTSGTLGMITEGVLVKYNKKGEQLWNKTWHKGWNDRANDIAIDSFDNIYVAGYQTPSPTENDKVMIVKFNRFGEEQWYHEYRDPYYPDDDYIANKILLDSKNDIIVVGDIYWGYIDAMIVKFYAELDITVNLPGSFNVFGNEPPDYDISVIDHKLNTTWYSLNSSVNCSFTVMSGEINKTLWDGFGNGTIIIKFYANNSVGDISFRNVSVYKDIFAPNITIKTPNSNQLYGKQSPTFDLKISDPHLNSTWYSLNDSFYYKFVGNNGIINQTEWDLFGNGTIFIKFYANDSVGNEAFKEIIIRKDINKPKIIIHEPTKNEIFGLEAPEFNLTISEKFSCIWYTLDNGITNISCNLIDKINQTLWDELSNGFINITFYVNDTIGNIGFINITIKKVTPVQPYIPPGGGGDNGSGGDDKKNNFISGYDPLIFIFLSFIISIIILVRKGKIKYIKSLGL